MPFKNSLLFYDFLYCKEIRTITLQAFRDGAFKSLSDFAVSGQWRGPGLWDKKGSVVPVSVPRDLPLPQRLDPHRCRMLT